MNSGEMNNAVAKELSDAMARCKQKGVDEQSLRTGLLTITIANFVNRIGMANSIALFSAIPEQISSGIFDRYIDPNTNKPNPAYSQPAAAQPHIPHQHSAPPPPPAQQAYHQPEMPPPSYHNAALPQNFVQPYPDPAYSPNIPAQPLSSAQGRRRLTE